MIELLRKRRSIRRFKDIAIEKEKVDLLKEAALRSPTSKNLHSWEFIFIDDKETIDELSGVRGQSSNFLKGAPLCLAVLGLEDVNDTWVEDASIAAIIVQLTALSLGLGSCWIQIRNRMHSDNESAESYVRSVLNIPEQCRVVCLVALGYPNEEKDPTPFDKLRWDKIHINKW